jgi:hypothetical protein
MKKYNILIAAAIIMSFSTCQPKEEQSNTQNEIVGVYQPIDNPEGMIAITEKYWVYAARWKNESSAVDSIDYYKNEYNLLRAEGCTWTMQDSIITCTFLFDKDPSMIGQSWRFTYSFNGDTCIFNALNDNNEIYLSVSALKLE